MPSIIARTMTRFVFQPRRSPDIMHGASGESEGGSQPEVARNSTTSSSLDLSSNSSPPSLIIAFLVLSIFTLTMIFIFTARRYPYLRARFVGFRLAATTPTLLPGVNRDGDRDDRFDDDHYSNDHRRRTKPELWDVRIPPCPTSATGGVRRWWWWEVMRTGLRAPPFAVQMPMTRRPPSAMSLPGCVWRWNSVLPLSACKVPSSSSSREEHASSSSSSSPSTRNVFQRFWRSMRVSPTTTTTTTTAAPNHISGHLHRPRATSTQFSSAESTMIPMKRVSMKPTSLRISVLIAMPTEHQPIYDRAASMTEFDSGSDGPSRHDDDDDDDNDGSAATARRRTVYELGHCDFSVWDPDPHTA